MITHPSVSHVVCAGPARSRPRRGTLESISVGPVRRLAVRPSPLDKGNVSGRHQPPVALGMMAWVPFEPGRKVGDSPLQSFPKCYGGTPVEQLIRAPDVGAALSRVILW